MPYGKFTHKAASSRRQSYLGGVVERRRKATSTARLKLARPVAQLVDRRINSKLELKVNNKFGNRVQLDNLPDVNTRVRYVLPNTNQGPQANERIGTQIKASSLIIKGCVTIPADDNPPLVTGDRADIQLRLMVLSSKSYKSQDGINDNWSTGTIEYSKIFKVNSIAEPPDGSLADMWKEVNTECFTTHYDKVFRMQRGVGYFPDVTSTSGAAHMPAINKSFFINVKCKNKVLKYEDSGNNEATNFCPFMIATWAYSDGSAPSSAAVPFYQSYSIFKFHDA